MRELIICTGINLRCVTDRFRLGWDFEITHPLTFKTKYSYCDSFDRKPGVKDFDSIARDAQWAIGDLKEAIQRLQELLDLAESVNITEWGKRYNYEARRLARLKPTA